MAGDWIKMRGNLWDDPRVSRLCDLLDCTEALIVGGLYWLWNTADQHTESGVLSQLTLRQIDRKTGIPGFGAALASIGWLTEIEEGIEIVRFDEHNGASAKKRAVTAKRVANHRSNADVPPAALQEEQGSVTGALAREREEKREITEPKGSVERASRKCPDSFVVTDEMREWAASECLGVNIERETEKLRDHTFKTARTNWAGVWRNWMREASDRLHGRGAVPMAKSFAASDREAGMQRWEQMTGRTHPDRLQAGQTIDMPDTPAPIKRIAA